MGQAREERLECRRMRRPRLRRRSCRPVLSRIRWYCPRLLLHPPHPYRTTGAERCTLAEKRSMAAASEAGGRTLGGTFKEYKERLSAEGGAAADKPSLTRKSSAQARQTTNVSYRGGLAIRSTVVGHMAAYERPCARSPTDQLTLVARRRAGHAARVNDGGGRAAAGAAGRGPYHCIRIDGSCDASERYATLCCAVLCCVLCGRRDSRAATGWRSSFPGGRPGRGSRARAGRTSRACRRPTSRACRVSPGPQGKRRAAPPPEQGQAAVTRLPSTHNHRAAPQAVR